MEAVPTTTMRAWRLMRRITASEIKPLVLSKIDIDALVGGLRERLFKAWRLIVDRMLDAKLILAKGNFLGPARYADNVASNAPQPVDRQSTRQRRRS